MRAFFFLIFFLLQITTSHGQGLVFNFDNNVLIVDTNWFAHEGDITDAQIKSLDFEGWDEIDSTFQKETSSSIIWYKNFFSIPDSLKQEAFTIKTICEGTCHVYINGKLVQVVSPDKSILRNYLIPAIYFTGDDSLHTIAIRTERKLHNGKNQIEYHPSVMIFNFKGEIQREFLATTIGTSFMIFTMTAFLVLAFFHLILFIFYKEERSNLFLGLFCLLLGAFFLVSMGKIVTGKQSAFHDLFEIVHFLLPFLPVFILGLFHTIFYGTLMRFFWFYLSAITILRVLEFFDIISGISGVISFIVYLDLIRIIIVAVRKRKPGSKIIGLGLLITLIVVPLVIAGFIHSSSNGFTSSEVWVISGILGAVALLLLSLPLTMSFHFASRFSRMNKDLKKQMIQVQELSDKTIAQEQEKKKILEQQKFNLEIEVEERTREVMIQKKQLEEKNKNITDSINYARKIQNAILHSENEFRQLFHDSFILFIPKDIVSGDFYWFHKKNDFIYVVCADCTGHGVPGAFMSMIGHTILDDIINDNADVQPANVLTELNLRIRDILKQDHGSETRDGMDITFSKYNPKTKILEVASGLRPVYIIREDNLLEVRADKFSIGGLGHDGKTFTNNSIQLKDGDVIYFFSDGYADQFGGEKGKKFMLKKFQLLLMESHKLPFEEQKKVLETKHIEWKKELDQVDDILVIGFKV